MGANRGPHLIGVEHAAIALEHADVGPRQGGDAARLGVHAVRPPIEDDLVARLAVDAIGHLVAHLARRKKNGVVLAQKLGHHGAKTVDRRILARLLVAHLGRRHGRAHGVGRPRLGIAGKIDQAVVHQTPPLTA